jgi:hypothetical protein
MSCEDRKRKESQISIRHFKASTAFPQEYIKRTWTTRLKDWKSLTIFNITILWFGTPNAEWFHGDESWCAVARNTHGLRR